MDPNDGLPDGWEAFMDTDVNKVVYVNHITKTSTWIDPRPYSSAPGQLPRGWELAVNPYMGPYFIDHNTWTTYLPEDVPSNIAKCIHMQADSLKEWKRIHDIDNANAVPTDENVLTNKRFHAIPRHMYIAEGRPVSSGSAMSTPSKIQWAERSLHGPDRSRLLAESPEIERMALSLSPESSEDDVDMIRPASDDNIAPKDKRDGYIVIGDQENTSPLMPKPILSANRKQYAKTKFREKVSKNAIEPSGKTNTDTHPPRHLRSPLMEPISINSNNNNIANKQNHEQVFSNNKLHILKGSDPKNKTPKSKTLVQNHENFLVEINNRNVPGRV
eukprot:m.16310 g.16310  ORF g.16310 m.16310 type:complete len:330 (-) comp5657_c0_seq2:92-1081(-)